MVKIFKKSMFVGDYGLTIDVETDLGLFTILTNFPRLNKWIGIKLVSTFSIYPGEKINWAKDTELHVRDLQAFLHQVIMKVQTDSTKTQKIVKGYKEIYAEN